MSQEGDEDTLHTDAMLMNTPPPARTEQDHGPLSGRAARAIALLLFLLGTNFRGPDDTDSVR